MSLVRGRMLLMGRACGPLFSFSCRFFSFSLFLFLFLFFLARQPLGIECTSSAGSMRGRQLGGGSPNPPPRTPLVVVVLSCHRNSTVSLPRARSRWRTYPNGVLARFQLPGNETGRTCFPRRFC